MAKSLKPTPEINAADAALMKSALIKAGYARGTPVKLRPPRQYLNDREERFVAAYLRMGSATEAAREAGYEVKDLARKGTELLNSPLIGERIKKVLDAKVADQIAATKLGLLKEIRRILVEGRPFERLKAAELLAKLEGWFAPSRKIVDHRNVGAISPYIELAATLRASPQSFPIDDRIKIRTQMEADRAAIDEVIMLLEHLEQPALPAGMVTP